MPLHLQQRQGLSWSGFLVTWVLWVYTLQCTRIRQAVPLAQSNLFITQVYARQADVFIP